MAPRLSIVTATIVRSGMERLCESIDRQINRDWEHVIIVDMRPEELNELQRWRLNCLAQADGKRNIGFCEKRHKNYGNTCRYNIAPSLKGEYVIIMDDDDYFLDNRVFDTLAEVKGQWAVFPIMHWGTPYLFLPPASCRTGNAMFIYKRELARYPDVDIYESDGVLVEELKTKAPWEVLQCRPLVDMPVSNHGKDV